MKITEFFDNEYTSYANYASFRNISSFVDGLKPSGRKVLWTIDKNGINSRNQKIKVASLASKTTDQCEYLHGSTSLEDVTVNLAQNFAGTNNINLLQPEGSFGNRCIQDASAPRYIFTYKSPAYDSIFLKSDKPILLQQEFEGTVIEPKFLLPTIPLILINGSQGIGNGFAQNILSRDVKEIQKCIENYVVKKQLPKRINPSFKGFKGIVSPVASGTASYEILGCFERSGAASIKVTELPITYDLEKYIAILKKLKEDKIIGGYTDKSDGENKFEFIISVTREFCKKDDRWILEKLKLIKRITENFTCIGENNEIVEFNSEVEILKAFCDVRLKYFTERKKYVISKLKEELLILGSKWYFVDAVLKNDIRVFRQTKAVILQQIKESTIFPFYEVDGKFDYLINLPIHSMSADTIDEIRKQISKKKTELAEMQAIEPNQMWLNELKEI